MDSLSMNNYKLGIQSLDVQHRPLAEDRSCKPLLWEILGHSFHMLKEGRDIPPSDVMYTMIFFQISSFDILTQNNL